MAKNIMCSQINYLFILFGVPQDHQKTRRPQEKNVNDKRTLHIWQDQEDPPERRLAAFHINGMAKPKQDILYHWTVLYTEYGDE